ncbi:hypothetical protein VTK73DRAFT_6807 [Phialemonium thermophilum]|uniref:ELYS-like domain-containing protein n=1 Tax=Phialemonium thermophilum TaxID=223376 RepID=A0ABR3Y760_9PEZI
MLDYSHFFAVFPSEGPLPYDHRGSQDIETLRKTFDGVLFIDRVLKTLGVGEKKSYPPKGESGLRGLHHQVCTSKVSSHHKLSVFYYLLLDFDGDRGLKSQLADDFAIRSGLPQKYQILMRGLWHMDRKEFKYALEHLAHPSLPPEFADDIVTTLVRHAKDGDYSLPLAYYYTTLPVFKTSEALDHLFGALARTNVTEALYFSRTYPESTRRTLFEKLVSFVLNDRSALAGARNKELVSLPFSVIEEAWFQEFLTSGEGSDYKLAASTVETRRIVTGRHPGQVRIRGLNDNIAPVKASKGNR